MATGTSAAARGEAATTKPFSRGHQAMTPLRYDCLMAYRGMCWCCGDRTLDRLEIDHANARRGEGNQHRAGIAPATLEQRLQAANYPESIDGYRIQLLCTTCHRSKTSHGVCMITHADVQDENTEEIPEDTEHSARSNIRRLPVTQARKPAKAVVMLSTRIDEETKAELERRAAAGKISQGQVIRNLIDLIETSGVSRHEALIGMLSAIEQRLGMIEQRLDIIDGQGSPPEAALVSPAGRFDYLDPSKHEGASPVPPMALIRPRPRWWARWIS